MIFTNLPIGWDRFKRYLAVMTGGIDDYVLPLQALNPMGKAYIADTLDALIAVDAETIASEAVVHVERRLGKVETEMRIGIVVADDVAGGWTNRELIEAHRLRTAAWASLKRGWLVVLYWASEPVTPALHRNCLAHRISARRTVIRFDLTDTSFSAFCFTV